MKRYTEDDFTFDSLFDIIRFICSSLFLAPVRLVNEITKKAPYMSKDCLGNVSITAMIINLILIIINIGLQLLHNKFSLVSGSLPLVSLLGSLIILLGFHYSLARLGFVKMRYKKPSEDIEEKETENKEDKNDNIEEVDYGINKTVSRPEVSLSDDNLINDEYTEDINDLKEERIKTNSDKINLDDEEEFECFGEEAIDFNDVFHDADLQMKKDDKGGVKKKFDEDFRESIKSDFYNLGDLDDSERVDCSADIEEISDADLNGILDDIIGDGN